jgi:hypothetical protein
MISTFFAKLAAPELVAIAPTAGVDDDVFGSVPRVSSSRKW